MDDFLEKIKIFLTFEMIIIIVLGVSVGLYVKSFAVQNLTIGFSDPIVNSAYDVYDIDVLEQSLIAQGIPAESTPENGENNIEESALSVGQ